MAKYSIRVTYRKGSLMSIWRIYFRNHYAYSLWMVKRPLSYNIMKVERDYAV